MIDKKFGTLDDRIRGLEKRKERNECLQEVRNTKANGGKKPLDISLKWKVRIRIKEVRWIGEVARSRVIRKDPNVGRNQKLDCFGGKILSTYNDNALFQHNKDMLTSKWSTLNVNCQKFNALHKRAQRLHKSGENEMDVLRHAKMMFKDENKGISFSQELPWEILRPSPKWDAPEPLTILMVNVEGTSGGNGELFSQDNRARPREHVRQKRRNPEARREPRGVKVGCLRMRRKRSRDLNGNHNKRKTEP
nr:hypothetical protein [Tanacetum cinerariifolium]